MNHPRLSDHPAPAENLATLQILPMRDLPALPAAVLDLIAMLARDNLDTGEVAAKMSVDPALAAKAMRLANSSFYGVPRHVTSVSSAISVLGLRTVRTILFAAALTGSFKAPPCPGFDFKEFWRRSVGIAVAAQLVAAATGSDPGTAFTAGLMLDIGQLVLATGHAERYARVLDQHRSSGCELDACERGELGIDHAAVGALMAGRWHFPDEIVTAIGRHHAGDRQADRHSLTTVVQLATLLMRGDPRETSRAAAAAGQALPESFWADAGDRIELQTQAICATLMAEPG